MFTPLFIKILLQTGPLSRKEMMSFFPGHPVFLKRKKLAKVLAVIIMYTVSTGVHYQKAFPGLYHNRTLAKHQEDSDDQLKLELMMIFSHEINIRDKVMGVEC